MLDARAERPQVGTMKILFAILATTLIAAAQVQILPAPGRPNVGIVQQIDPATGLPIVGQPPNGGPDFNEQPFVEAFVEEFFGPGRFQLTPAQILVDGKTASVVMKIDTITGQVWHLQWTQNTMGKLTAKFIEVEGNPMRPRPGGVGGGFGFPGGVINPEPAIRDGGPAGITTQPGRPTIVRESAPPAIPPPAPSPRPRQ